jgi:2,4-dienoyl-CoA reductase-like NADH-dependent reductase (Old Yellow Enzyme family)
MTFRNLFRPIKTKGMEIRNRIVMLPMTTGYNEQDETVSAKFIEFFAEMAKGGGARPERTSFWDAA